MPSPKLTNEIIAAAIDGFEAQKARIDGQIAELRAMLAGDSGEPPPTPESTRRKRRRMSTAGRKAISGSTRKPWAAFHAAKHAAEKPSAAKKPSATGTARRRNYEYDHQYGSQVRKAVKAKPSTRKPHSLERLPLLKRAEKQTGKFPAAV